MPQYYEVLHASFSVQQGKVALILHLGPPEAPTSVAPSSPNAPEKTVVPSSSIKNLKPVPSIFTKHLPTPPHTPFKSPTATVGSRTPSNPDMTSLQSQTTPAKTNIDHVKLYESPPTDEMEDWVHF